LTIPGSVTSIGYQALSGCDDLTLRVMEGSYAELYAKDNGIPYVATNNTPWLDATEANERTDSSGMWKYVLVDGGAKLVGYIAEPKGALTIPSAVDKYKLVSIGDWAFLRCSGLTSVTVGNHVLSIGEGAFAGCSGLTSVAILEGVTDIGDRVFEGCSKLATVTIADSVTSIGYSAFSGCDSLASVTLPSSIASINGGTFIECRSLTSVTIPNSVTSIGQRAFQGCSGLTNVTIPESVISIGDRAFDGCSGITLRVKACSYAHQYAAENGIPVMTQEWHDIYQNVTSQTEHVSSVFETSVGKTRWTAVDFAYSDSFFAKSSTVENPELAMASVALASVSYVPASEYSGITITLSDNMNFMHVEQTFPIVHEADNDKVGFTFGHKPITIEGKPYELYCVAIRGTPTNAEWFSNFRVGENTRDHMGFHDAAKGVQTAFDKYIKAHPPADPSGEIKIWVFGHSRGGAVANILAYSWGKNGTYTEAENVYGYTFASPRVSMDFDREATYIWNYVNAGDTVTQFPLAGWGYGRHGRDIRLSENIPQMKIIFKRLTGGVAYGGKTSGSDIQAYLDLWIPTKMDYYYESEFARDLRIGALVFSPRDVLMDVAAILGGQPNADIRALQATNRIFLSGPKALAALDCFGWDVGLKGFEHSHCQELYIAWVSAMYGDPVTAHHTSSLPGTQMREPVPTRIPDENIISSVDWSWSKDNVSFGEWNCGVQLFARPVENCIRFTLEYEFRAVSKGDPYGAQDIYIKTTEGIWKKVGSLHAPDNQRVIVTIDMDAPTDICGVGIAPAKSTSVSTNYDNWFAPKDFIVR